MAKITATCTCKACGKTFDMANTLRNSRMAEEWRDWASNGGINRCRDCYNIERAQKEIERLGKNGKEIKEMSYREYKTNCANYETIKGSYNAEAKTIKVVIPRDPAKLLNPLEAIDWLEAHTKKW